MIVVCGHIEWLVLLLAWFVELKPRTFFFYTASIKVIFFPAHRKCILSFIKCDKCVCA